MSRIRRAWAVLRGRDDPEIAASMAYARYWQKEYSAARGWTFERVAQLKSLHATINDHTATIARLSAEAKARNDLTREAHALLGRAITDDGVPQP
jgi:hypothetical protein